LDNDIARYQGLLNNRQSVIELIFADLDVIADKFGDDRLTQISNDMSNIDDEDLIPKENVVITLTTNGYIKRMSPETFRTQNRGGRGVKGLSMNENDLVSILVNSRTHTDLLFFSNLGKVYRMRGYQVPEFARTAKGIPVVNLLNLEKSETIRSIISVDAYDDGHFLFFTTLKGVVKRTAIKEFSLIRQNGKIAITLREGDQLYDVNKPNQVSSVVPRSIQLPFNRQVILDNYIRLVLVVEQTDSSFHPRDKERLTALSQPGVLELA
jgi:DNA gyrase subunit A